MKKVRRILLAVYYSLPVQLLIRQLHQHKILLLFWLILLMIMTGGIGSGFGAAYLFLEPEYMGKENFWSSLILGSALGGFLFAYCITFFINESYRFHFIARHKSPFYVLSLNNFIIPGGFLLTFFGLFLKYHLLSQNGWNYLVFEKMLGLTLGLCLVFLISASYFFANRTLFDLLGEQVEDRFAQAGKWRKRPLILDKALSSLRQQKQPHSYLAHPFKINKVPDTGPAQLRQVVNLLSENHGKLLILQVTVFILLAVLGLSEDHRFAQIPAGASVLLVFSLCIMISGAITFWFRRLGVILVVASMIGFGFYNQFSLFYEENPAFGMDYSVKPAEYNRKNLAILSNESRYNEDREQTLLQLDQWAQNYKAKYGPEKPRAVFITASGGGLRSAVWTFRVMQYLDSLTQHRLTHETRLYSGASGGMFGLTYFRELYFRQLSGEEIVLSDPKYREAISQDILNRIFFQQFTDILLPNRRVQVGNNRYLRETGYSFDHQLSTNLPELKDRRLGDYAQFVSQGKIPPLVLTPTVLNQGRKLYITSLPASFLTRPSRITDRYLSKSSGIEFRRLFEEQGADSLCMTTALRMNATFPYVLPIVELPSNPPMQVMDAGAIDNYGTQTALKYLFEFREWFAANTSGVFFIQIRDNYREDPIQDARPQNILNEMLRPVGGGLYSMAEAKDMANDYLLEFVQEWYDGYVEVIPIEYPREAYSTPASLSWHLTQKEKDHILNCIQSKSNTAAFNTIFKLYDPGLIAQEGRL